MLFNNGKKHYIFSSKLYLHYSFKKKKNKHNLEIYKINFGYTQVLFMGSVPRINCLLAIVPSKKVNDYLKSLAEAKEV